jgi:O-antigen/teichoic acid export membrane protein
MRRPASDQVALDEARPTPPEDEQSALLREDLKRRTSAGLFIVATRGLLVLLVGFGGNVVLARLLTPHDFGTVAIGMSFVLFAGMLSDGGLGAALIRRAEPPEPEELEALLALQLAVTIGLTFVIAAVGSQFGRIGWVTAIMVSSMPLVTLQFPGRITLERSLSYRPLAMVEVSQVLTYYAWSIAFVVAGAGVWGLATGTVVMRAAAALLMVRISPVGIPRPRFSWHRIRTLIGFGVRFQAANATWLARDQGLNAGIAVVASVSTLGLWSLARRLLEIPFLLLNSIWRVSFPAMSQLLAAKEDPAPLIERAVGIAAVGSGIILTGLAGSAPGLIPGLFGDQWREASNALPGACLGLGVGGSISVATQGYLYAVGDASAVLRAVIFQTITLFAVTFPLLPVMGLWAVGLGIFASSVVDAVVLRQATWERTRVRLVQPLLAPVTIGVISASIGWLIADRAGADLVSGVAGGACSILCFQAGLLVFRRDLLFETFRFIGRAMRAALARPAAPDSA